MKFLENKLKLRLYQEKILATAAKNNTLCILPTGLGKTFICIALTALKLKEKEDSKVLILAPTKPLIKQHKRLFMEFFEPREKINMLSGEIKPKERADIWKNSQIIFATPQTIESGLITNKINLKDVSLMTIDECLTEDTKILLSNNTLKPIKEVVNNFIEGKEIYVLSFDYKKNIFVSKRIINAKKIPCFKKIIKIHVSNKFIEATEDHKFLANRNENICWVPATELTLNDKLAIYPELEENSFTKNKILIDEEDIIKTYSKDQQKNLNIYKKVLKLRRELNWGELRIHKKLGFSRSQIKNWVYNNIKPKPIRTVEQMKLIGILPLTVLSPNTKIIACIVGHIYGDGWFSHKNTTKAVVGFSGKVEDLKMIQHDLDLLKLKYSKIYSRITKSKVKNREIIGKTNSFTCSDVRLTRLLTALKIPSGKKTSQRINIPDWLLESEKDVKREFLAALFGSDGCCPMPIKNGRNIYCIRFSINKVEKLKDNAIDYMKQIRGLLKEFDIKTSEINIIQGNIWKDGTETKKVILTISNSLENVINFLSNISFRYCNYKERIAKHLLDYFIEKCKLKNIITQKYKDAINLRKKGYGISDISTTLNIPVHQLERWLYQKRKPGMVPLSFQTFENFSKLNSNNFDIKWAEVKSIRISNKRKFVYDLAVEESHNFIANGIIVHNCHRAVKDYSYVWLAKQYMQQAENPKILALTASPGSNKETIETIYKNLFIEKLEIREEQSEDVAPYVQKKEITEVRIDLPDSIKELKELFENSLRNRLKILKEQEVVASSDISKIRKKDLLLLQGKLASEMSRDFRKMQQVSMIAACIKVLHCLELLQTQGIASLVNFLENIKKQVYKTKASKDLINDLEFREAMQRAFELEAKKVEHPKLDILLDIIKKQLQTKEDSKIIIFANFRSSVERIVKLLNKIENCRPIALIGQSGERGLTQKEQVNILREFESDLTNILVCTSIGEEGLSIGSLDVAIFYESVPSEIRTIQRSGRVGRCKVGKVIMLITKDTVDEKYYWIARHKEKKMKEILGSMQQKSIGEY